MVLKNPLNNPLNLGIFCLISLFKILSANNIPSELSTINYENLIQKINFDKYEVIGKDIEYESNSKQNIVDGYDDSKCVQQFAELKRSLNESEMWAIAGETNYIWMKIE